MGWAKDLAIWIGGSGSGDLGKNRQGDIAIFFTGASFLQPITSTIIDIASKVAEGMELQYAIYNLFYFDKDNTVNSAFNEIMDMKSRFPDCNIFLYGYSYGGVAITDLAYKLNAANITINYMVTVDAANGYWSNDVIRTIPRNVQWEDNFWSN